MKLKDILLKLWQGQEVIIETLNARVFKGFVDDDIDEKYLKMDVFMIMSHGNDLIKIIIE